MNGDSVHSGTTGTVVVPEVGRDMPLGERFANSRLIAAAPEMLAALYAIRDEGGGECGCADDPDSSCTFHQAKDQIERAIAKAEGRE